MNVLEKILEEIEEMRDIMESTVAMDCFGKDCEHDDCTVCVCERAMEIIRSHMDDIPNDGWIPVEERLPETPKENLAFDNKPVELYLVDIGHEYPIRAFWNGKNFVDGWSVLKAIAWRPLPEPYKPKKLKTEEKPVQ